LQNINFQRKSILASVLVLAICFWSNISFGIAGPKPASPNSISSEMMLQNASNSSMRTHGDSFLHHYGPWMIAVVAGTPLFAVDKNIMKFSQRRSLHSKLANNVFQPVHTIGQGWEYGIAIPLVVHGLIFKKNRSMVIAGELVAGLAAEGIIVQTFKLSFGRLRPYQSSSPYKFFKGGFSFFSGDVSTAFTFSTIIAKNYPRQNLGFIGIHHNVPLIPIFGYAAGGMVCLQRLYSNAHWSSDDYFGALAGYAVGSIVYHYGKKLHLKGFSLTSGRSRVLAACFSFN
jgi:membrane-associated phospholipid phosphatase